jgi:hypothetical protein
MGNNFSKEKRKDKEFGITLKERNKLWGAYTKDVLHNKNKNVSFKEFCGLTK